MKQATQLTPPSTREQRLACAAQILEMVPMLMGSIRRRMRQNDLPKKLSMPQFGILIFLRHNEGSTLSDLADHLGLLRPTMSKMVHALVEHDLVTRQGHPSDRRRVRLGLTEAGARLFDAHEGRMRASLAEMIVSFSEDDRQAVSRAMTILQGLVADPKGLKGLGPPVWQARHERGELD